MGFSLQTLAITAFLIKSGHWSSAINIGISISIMGAAIITIAKIKHPGVKFI